MPPMIYGFEIKSNRRINNPVKPMIVSRPPNPSHLRAMTSPIIALIPEIATMASFTSLIPHDSSDPKISEIKKNKTKAKMVVPHIRAIQRIMFSILV